MTLPAHRYAQRAKPSQDGPHNFGVDIDGVLDAFPRQIGAIMSALTAAAHMVYVITGAAGDTVTQEDVDAKREFLTSVGIGEAMYAELIVVPKPHAENKAKVIEDNKIGVLIDNSKSNVKAAAKAGCVSLLLWNSKEK